jgi:hypothetical protein
MVQWTISSDERPERKRRASGIKVKRIRAAGDSGPFFGGSVPTLKT